MTKIRRTHHDKLKRIVGIHLQYAERLKKLEANKTRHNYLHTAERRKQQQHRTNYQNKYDRIRAYLDKIRVLHHTQSIKTLLHAKMN